jgi:outer membrane lipoprotein-sorting protein
VKLLRTLSTRSLALLIVAIAALAAGGTVIALAADGGGPTPPPKPLDQAIHDALSAPKPNGVTARIAFTNKLIPSGALLGNAGSALLSGASGRLWLTGDGKGRIELQSDAGDVQIVWDSSTVSIYDASTRTVYKAKLPTPGGSAGSSESSGPPSLAEIDSLLSKLGAHATISAAKPADVAGHAAYSVSVSPKHDGGLLGSAELAWDAARGVPLRVAIFAQGSNSPVLELKVTEISFGPVPASDVEVQPPSDTKVVELSPPSGNHAEQHGPPVTGLSQVQAAAGFPVKAPDTLVGLPRQDVRLIGNGDSKTALVLYGHGLGGLVVVEHAASGGAGPSGALSALPRISLDGITAHELATQLGTVLSWQANGTAFVLGGSLPPAAAEAAARALR